MSTAWTGLTANTSNNKLDLDSKMSDVFFTTAANDASLYSYNIELYNNKTYTDDDRLNHTSSTGAPDSNVYDAANRQSIRSLNIAGKYSALVKIETNNNVAWFYEVKWSNPDDGGTNRNYVYRIYKVTFTEANSSQR